MSHVTTGGICVTDLADVEAALEKFPGAKLVEGKTRFKWYGKFLNDWHNDRAAVRKGWDPKTFGQCAHVITHPDSGYEIGLVERDDGSGFDLMYDVFGTGQNLERAFGVGLVDLKTEIGMEAAERVYAPLGYQCDRFEEDGRQKMRIWR